MSLPLRKILFVLTLFAALAAGCSQATKSAPKTAAPHSPALAASGSYVFVAYGDTRSHPEDHRRIIALIVKTNPEFVLQTGDLVFDGKDLAEWQEFDGITKPLRDAQIAYYPARGNHDIGPYYIKHVTEPYDSGDGYYYAFTRHHTRFIALDDFSDYDEGSDQYKWLISQLITANKKKLFTIVYFHESPFSVGPHGSNFEVQRTLHPVFVKYHVPLIFGGHDHLYYRTKRDGVQYVVTGGGGAELYSPTNSQYAIPGDVIKKVHHIIRCEMTGKTVKCTAIEPGENGGPDTVFDTFTVTAP